MGRELETGGGEVSSPLPPVSIPSPISPLTPRSSSPISCLPSPLPPPVSPLLPLSHLPSPSPLPSPSVSFSLSAEGMGDGGEVGRHGEGRWGEEGRGDKGKGRGDGGREMGEWWETGLPTPPPPPISPSLLSCSLISFRESW
ncbi:unnamed protein product [Rangifer tarandus platyrhynchus]|uniref:Uncharacterized protein n=1 Tax=Rangifer tarandus platyrhynchus TaxID=3082113 RepID=A0AC59Y3Y6_RANTA